MKRRAAFVAAVEIERRDHRFADAREDGALAPPAARRFRRRQHDMIGKPRRFCGSRTSFAAHQRVQLQRQQAFGVFGIKPVQLVGDDEAQHAIAQKFETLVGTRRIGARMRQRPREQAFVLEHMAQSGRERVFRLSQWT